MAAFDILIYRWWPHILTGFWTRIWLFRQPRNRPHGIWIQVLFQAPVPDPQPWCIRALLTTRNAHECQNPICTENRIKNRFRNAIHTPHNLALAIARRHRNLCYSALDMLPFLVDCYCCCCCCCCCSHVNIIAYEHAAFTYWRKGEVTLVIS